MNGPLDDETFKQNIISDPLVRQTITKRSFLYFFPIYFASEIEYPFAHFHREMIELVEHPQYKITVVMAFRGSGKSTIMNTANTLFSILGEKQKKFVVVVSKTKPQAKIHFENIKNHLTYNELLKQDMGPFQTSGEDFGSYSLEIPKFGSKIISVSSGQGLRGMKHNSHRPDLIILDDVEDTTSVINKRNREETYQWFLSEVIPAGDSNTEIFVLGNLLHTDSLLMSLKKGIDEKSLDGIFRAYPLYDDKGKILWPGKFPGTDAVRELQKSIGDEGVWKREYILAIVPKLRIRIMMYGEKNPNEELEREKIHYDESTFMWKAGFAISAPTAENLAPPILEWIDEEDKDRDEETIVPHI